MSYNKLSKVQKSYCKQIMNRVPSNSVVNVKFSDSFFKDISKMSDKDISKMNDKDISKMSDKDISKMSDKDISKMSDKEIKLLALESEVDKTGDKHLKYIQDRKEKWIIDEKIQMSYTPCLSRNCPCKAGLSLECKAHSLQDRTTFCEPLSAPKVSTGNKFDILNDIQDEEDKDHVVTLHIRAAKLNYGPFIGWHITSDVPFNPECIGLANHPFRQCSKKFDDEGLIYYVGDVVADNEVTRSILNHLSNPDKLNNSWQHWIPCSTASRLINALCDLWD